MTLARDLVRGQKIATRGRGFIVAEVQGCDCGHDCGHVRIVSQRGEIMRIMAGADVRELRPRRSVRCPECGRQWARRGTRCFRCNMRLHREGLRVNAMTVRGTELDIGDDIIGLRGRVCTLTRESGTLTISTDAGARHRCNERERFNVYRPETGWQSLTVQGRDVRAGDRLPGTDGDITELRRDGPFVVMLLNSGFRHRVRARGEIRILRAVPVNGPVPMEVCVTDIRPLDRLDSGEIVREVLSDSHIVTVHTANGGIFGYAPNTMLRVLSRGPSNTVEGQGPTLSNAVASFMRVRSGYGCGICGREVPDSLSACPDHGAGPIVPMQIAVREPNEFRLAT